MPDAVRAAPDRRASDSSRAIRPGPPLAAARTPPVAAPVISLHSLVPVPNDRTVQTPASHQIPVSSSRAESNPCVRRESDAPPHRTRSKYLYPRLATSTLQANRAAAHPASTVYALAAP